MICGMISGNASCMKFVKITFLFKTLTSAFGLTASAGLTFCGSLAACVKDDDRDAWH